MSSSNKWILRIVENWPAKVLSIAVALVLFVFHHMSTMTTRPLSVPLLIETNSALVPASSYPLTVRVQLRGEDDGIKSIAESDIEAYVDFSRFEHKGYYRAPVHIRKKGSALGVEPLEISVNPLEVFLELDLKDSKTLPLTADIRGITAAGFDLVSHSVTPAEIVVSGPAGVLENLAAIRTDPVSLDGRTGDFSIQVNIARTNSFITYQGNGMAEFHGAIRPSFPVRNIDGIPITVIGLEPGLDAGVSIRTGNVRIEGTQTLLDAFRPTAGFLSVDCSLLTEPGEYTLPVEVRLPYGFVLLRREPEQLIVTITRKEQE